MTARARRTRVAAVGAAALLAGVVAVPTIATAAPPTDAELAPADPGLVFEETFENGVDTTVTGLENYTGGTGETYTADAGWLNAAWCNGLVLQDGADWSGDGAPCPADPPRPYLEELAKQLGGSGNHVVAAYTQLPGDAPTMPAGTLLAESTGAGITMKAGHFYVASIDIAEVNCRPSTPNDADSRIQFGFIGANGEVVMDPNPAVACKTGAATDLVIGGNNETVRSGHFYSAGFKAEENADNVEYVARNLATKSWGNDVAYDNLRFYDATPTLLKNFSEDEVEVGQPVKMTFTVVNTSELSEKTGWSFTDELPAGMTVADEAWASSTCAAADVTAEPGASSITIENGSIAKGVASCQVSLSVVLGQGGEFTNVIEGASGLAGEPSATVKALTPHMSLVKTASPDPITPNTKTVDYTFVLTNDGETPLNDASISDPGPVGGAGTMSELTTASGDACAVDTLAIGDTLECVATYTLAADDHSGKALENEATGNATSPGGTALTAPGEAAVDTVLPAPKLELAKSATGGPATKVGQVITYNFEITNTGNVDVDDVAVDEGTFTGKGTLGAVECPADEVDTLAVGGSVTCTATYTVVAGDLTGKDIENTATAAGSTPYGDVESAAAEAELPTVAPTTPASPLAQTGASADGLAIGGLVLLALGAGSVVLARRRVS